MIWRTDTNTGTNGRRSRRPKVMRGGPFAAVVLASLLLAPVGVLVAAPAGAIVPTGTQLVVGALALNGVACTSPTSCVAVGRSSSGGVVVPIVNGVPGKATPVPGIFALDGVACPTATTCEAVGEGPGGSSIHGVVVQIRNGTPGAALDSGTGTLSGIACPDTKSCEAVGRSPSGAAIVAIANGVPGFPQTVPGIVALNGIACPTTSICKAVGMGQFGGPGFSNQVTAELTITAGVPGPPGGGNLGALHGIACPSATTCEAVGTDFSGTAGGITPDAIVVTMADGEVDTTQKVAGLQTLLGVDCATVTNCLAVGFGGTEVPISHGAPGIVQSASGLGFGGVACPTAGVCEAVGTSSDGNEGAIVTITSLKMTVEGTQTFQASTPFFSIRTRPPAGDTVSGSLTCTTVGNPAITISRSLPVGSYVLNANSCSGLTVTGPTAGNYQVQYADGTFTVEAPVTANVSPSKLVSGTVNLESIACASATICEAVGVDSSHHGVVVTITDGVAGAGQAVAGTGSLDHVVCPSSTICEAIGWDGTLGSSAQAVLVTITNGTPGAAHPIPGTSDLVAIACPTAVICEAVGSFNSPNGEGAVVSISQGVPGTAEPVPNTFFLNSVACPSATTCEAVGSGPVFGMGGTTVVITDGLPGVAQGVSGTSFLASVACEAAVICEAVGTTPRGPGATVRITNGTPGTIQLVPGTATLSKVVCPSTTTCEALAQTNVIPIVNGVPASAEAGAAGLLDLACGNAMNCFAVGADSSGGIVMSITNSVAGSIQEVRGTFDLFAIACRQSSDCVAVGSTIDPGGPSPVGSGVVVTINNGRVPH
jgi:hypothetical protein